MGRYLCIGAAALFFSLSGCPKKGAKGPPLSAAERKEAARKAVAALQAGNFDEAAREAKKVRSKDPGYARAAAVRAISRYMEAMHNFAPDLIRRMESWGRKDTMHGYLHRRFEEIDRGLARVEKDLAAASRDPSFSLRLCLACWRRDWNHDGRINRIDEWVFQIELDENGRRLGRRDPRRRPTFKFDRGDVFWARAMVSFQRALFNLLIAYRLPTLDEVRAAGRGGRIVVRLLSKKRVRRARKLILAGLDHADRARKEYLAEKDDEAEWVPNPSQKNHPLPLPVDKALYETWEGVVGDLKKLVKGKEGLSVSELAQLGGHRWKDPPRGYIHIGRLLSKPGHIGFTLRYLKAFKRRPTRRDVERVLQDVFGDKYVRKMKPSRLITRLLRMRKEIARGQESLGRKLRYLLWLN